MSQHTPTPYDLTHLAMVGRDGLSVFLIPSATPDQALNERRKKERADILRAVNSHAALLEAAKYFRSLVDADLLDSLTRKGNPYNEAIAQAEGKP